MSSPEASPVTNTTASPPPLPLVNKTWPISLSTYFIPENPPTPPSNDMSPSPPGNDMSPPPPPPAAPAPSNDMSPPPLPPPPTAPAPSNDMSPPPLPPPPTAPAPSNDMSPSPPTPAPTPGGMSRATLIGLVMGTVLGGIMLIFVGICAFSYKRRKWRRTRRYGLDKDCGAHSQPPKGPSAPVNLGSERPHPPPSPGIASRYTFSYNELASATDGFSSLNFLGEGGFGYVYKGVLPDGKTVAIKQLKPGSGQGEREFQAEVEVISPLHHRHLVSLVGFCMAGTQRLLVYEFVPNNTLEFHLHEKDRPTMDWPTRMKIAIGCAKGLAYLHEDCQPQIIHRDIKASNILLDDSFEAKVADFGLAKFKLDTDTHVSTRVMGTHGYLDPEYHYSGKLTDKSDVFSFGIVLLELITGRKPIDKTQSFTGDRMLTWARPLLSQALKNGNFNHIVDPRLEKSYIPEEMTRMVACAATCVRRTARRRPRMSQVVRALEGNMTLDNLNEGTPPGHSREVQEQSTTGEHSRPSSEYGQYWSTSSSGGQQNTQEMEIRNVKSNT